MKLNDENVKGKAGQKGNDHDEKPAERAMAPSRFSKMKGLIASLAVLGTLASQACSGEETSNTPNVPATDGGCTLDGGCTSDGGHDAGVGGDAGHDSGVGGEAGYDAGVGGDAGHDSGVGGEAGADAGPVVCAEATTGYYSGMIYAGSPMNVGGYVWEYAGIDASGNILLNVSCGGNVVETAYPFPEDVATLLVITNDGKKATVTPHSGNTNGTKVTIEVQNL